MNAEEVIEKFKSAGALLEGHFILSSGLHSPVYLQCAIALESTASAAEFGAALAQQFADSQIETVASPAIGGIVIGYEVARQLGVRFIWTEREDGRMTLRRGFQVRKGERVLVVEDVITTGGSTRETIDALNASGAKVVAAGSRSLIVREARLTWAYRACRWLRSMFPLFLLLIAKPASEAIRQ